MADTVRVWAARRLRTPVPRVLGWTAVVAGIVTMGWTAPAGGAPKSTGTTAAKTTGAKSTGVKTNGACVVAAHPDASRHTQCAGAALSGAALAGVDLSYAVFTDANLTGANLTDANLTDANLTGANLDQAQLNGVTWSSTVCPDGTNSDVVDGSCLTHRSKSAAALPPDNPAGPAGAVAALPPTPVGPAGALAFTGFDPWPFVVAGLGLIGAGASLIEASRRSARSRPKSLGPSRAVST